MIRKSPVAATIAACLAAFAVPSLANAQQPQSAPGKVIVLKAARMFDGKADHVVSPGLVVVNAGKITAVGQGAAIPPGAQIIDLGDATLLPGFIDAHTHLSEPYQRDYRQGEMDLLKKAPAERALIASADRAHHPDGRLHHRARCRLGRPHRCRPAQRHRRGQVPGPRMLVSVRAIGSTGGHCDPAAGSSQPVRPRGRHSATA